MEIIIVVNGGIAGVDAIAGGVQATQLGFSSVFWVIAIVSAISTILSIALLLSLTE